MRRLMIFVLMFAPVTVTGCFTMVLPGPYGPEKVVPLAGSMSITMHNACAPIIQVIASHNVVEISLDNYARVELPVSYGEPKEQQVVFKAMTADRHVLGTSEPKTFSDYQNVYSLKQYTIGRYENLYDRQGRNICQQ